MAKKYLFADESGDMQFVKNGKASRYFAVGTLHADASQTQALRTRLMEVRDDLAWTRQGWDSCFHAAPNPQDVRDEVFNALSGLDFRFDITLLEKSKAQPSIRPDEARFYKHAWYFHLKHAAPSLYQPGDSIQVVAAEYGQKKTRQAFRGAVNDVMNQKLQGTKHVLAFWRDDWDYGLQAVDYCTWAVTRKWERGDDRSYKLIKNKIGFEHDFFFHGTDHYY